MESERETQLYVHSDVTGQLWQIFLNKVRLLDGCTLKPKPNCLLTMLLSKEKK